MTANETLPSTPVPGAGGGELAPAGNSRTEPNGTSRTWAALTHISAFSGYLGLPFGIVIGPLVMWLIRRPTDPFVDEHGREALNFHVSMLLYMLVAGLFSIILIGLPFLLVFMVLDIVFPIIAAVKAGDGLRYRYPLTIRFF